MKNDDKASGRWLEAENVCNDDGNTIESFLLNGTEEEEITGLDGHTWTGSR